MKLADVTPLVVAKEVCDLVAEHLGKLAFKMSPVMELRQGRDPLESGTDLGVTVQDLTRYAQTGDSHPDEAWDAAQSVCEALYSQAGVRGFGIGALAGDGEPESGIDAVLLATHCRVQIAADKPVTARSLAVLAGVSKRYVNQLISKGELKATAGTRARGGSEIPARDALVFLAGRVIEEPLARKLLRNDASLRYDCAGRLYVSGGLPVEAIATAEGWERRGKAWTVTMD